MRCHQKVVAMDLPASKPIGRLRQEVRNALRQDLEEVNALAKELLGL